MTLHSPFPQVILVDEHDHVIGRMEKHEAHKKGLLHRAFSIFILRKNEDDETEVLLQMRGMDKYHSGGLLSNTACSHPQPGHELITEAEKCLNFELGITVPLKPIGKITYRAEFENSMTEHEIDHVFVGFYDEDTDNIPFNPDEIESLRWSTITTIAKDLGKNPHRYTAWFPKTFQCLQDFKGEHGNH